LFKHLFGIAYNILLNEIKTWYNVGPNTLSTNIKRVILMTRTWITSLIKKGNVVGWRTAASSLRLPRSILDTVQPILSI
jgi:hypothetical protein